MSRKITVGLWGPSSSGKTMLLASLYIHRERHGGDWTVYGTPEAEPFIRVMSEQTRTHGLFPPKTQAGTAEQVFYRFRHASGDEAELRIEDRAGEELVLLPDERRRALVDADAMLLLFDPLENPRSLVAHVDKVFDFLHSTARRGVEKDPRPVAVCLTKADEILRSNADLEQARAHPQQFAARVLHDIEAGTVLHRLEHFCARYRLFPVTSVGVRRHWGEIEPVVYYDEGLRERIGPANESLSLLQPFEWLFDQVREG